MRKLETLEAARDAVDETCELHQCGTWVALELFENYQTRLTVKWSATGHSAREHGRHSEVVWCSGSKHLLDSCCLRQHTMSLNSTEAELREFVNGMARELFIRNVLQAVDLKAIVRVGPDSSAAGITQRLGSGRARRLEVKDLWVQEKGPVA